MVRIHRGRVQYGEESTYGTAVTADKALGYYTDFSPDLSADVEAYPDMSRIDKPSAVLKGYEISLSTTVEPVNGDFLEYIFGYKSGSGTSADPYIFKFYDSGDSSVQVAAFNVDSLTVEDIMYDDSGSTTATQYVGCKMNKVDFDFTKKEIVKATIGMDAQTYTTGATPSTAVDVTGDPFVANSVTSTIGSFSGEIDSFKLSIAREHEKMPTMSHKYIAGLVSKPVKVTSSLSLTYDDDEFTDYIKSGSDVSVSFKVAYDTNRYMQFAGTMKVNKVGYKRSPDDAFILQDIDGEIFDLVATTSNSA